jgi:hypothetical protein
MGLFLLRWSHLFMSAAHTTDHGGDKSAWHLHCLMLISAMEIACSTKS